MSSIIGEHDDGKCDDNLVGITLSGELNMFIVMAFSCFGMISVCLPCGTMYLVDLVPYYRKCRFFHLHALIILS